MRIVVTMALFEDEPKNSLRSAYFRGLSSTLQEAGHELWLVTSHWGAEVKRTLNMPKYDLFDMPIWSFPAPVSRQTLESLSGSSLEILSERKNSSPLSKFEERLFLELSGYAETAFDFIKLHENTIDLCIFLSMTDPFSLLGPLAFENKSLLIPLAENLDWKNLVYCERALAHAGLIGCCTLGEFHYFKDQWNSPVKDKLFLLGLPGSEAFSEVIASHAIEKFDPSLLAIEVTQDRPLSIEVLNAFSNHYPIVSTTACRSVSAEILESFGGWMLKNPLELQASDAELEFQNSAQCRLRGENAWTYYQWLSLPTNYIRRFEQGASFPNQKKMQSFQGKMLIIAYRYIGAMDAVGYDVIKQYENLMNSGATVKIYCEYCDPHLESYRASEDFLSEVLSNPQAFLIYHLAISWPDFEDRLVRACCHRIGKYHNITPKEFFHPYSEELAHNCEMARSNLKVLVETQQFETYWACSEFNKKELINYGANPERCSIVEPFHKANGISFAQLSPGFIELSKKKNLKILCVGRIAPNKGHKDLVAAVAEYIRHFDRQIEIYVVGAVDPRLEGYLEDIRQLIKKRGLTSIINLCGRLSHSEVATLYHLCDALLVLSHHEGFCVPVVEAQVNLLPVIAYRTTALMETVNDKEALFEVGDFYSIAARMRDIRMGSLEHQLSS